MSVAQAQAQAQIWQRQMADDMSSATWSSDEEAHKHSLREREAALRARQRCLESDRDRFRQKRQKKKQEKKERKQKRELLRTSSKKQKTDELDAAELQAKEEDTDSSTESGFPTKGGLTFRGQCSGSLDEEGLCQQTRFVKVLEIKGQGAYCSNCWNRFLNDMGGQTRGSQA